MMLLTWILMTVLIAALAWLALEVRCQRQALNRYAEATAVLARVILVRDPLRHEEHC